MTETQDPAAPDGALAGHINQNLETIVALQRRERNLTSPSQRSVERISRFIGRPAYLLSSLALVLVWILYNAGGASLGWPAFDRAPFPILQGLLTLIALLTTTIVLIAQNRQTMLERQHAHLDLQINLLTEQKVSKLILLMEELRHDLPIEDRHDAQAAALQETVDTAQVLDAIKETGITEIEKSNPGAAGRHHAAKK